MRRFATIGLAAAALLLAGCSSSSDAASEAGTDQTASAAPTDAPSTAPSGAAGGSSDFQAYTQCLSDNGVDVSSLGQGGPGGDGTRPSGMPTDRPTDLPSGMPTDMPSGMPTDGAGRGPGGGGLGGSTQAPDGVDEQTWQAAQEACADLRPTGGPAMGGQNGQGGSGSGSGSGSGDGATESYQVFWSCMADHDVEQTDSGLPTDLDTSDSAVAQALKTCQKLLPEGTTLGS